MTTGEKGESKCKAKRVSKGDVPRPISPQASTTRAVLAGPARTTRAGVATPGGLRRALREPRSIGRRFFFGWVAAGKDSYFRDVTFKGSYQRECIFVAVISPGVQFVQR